MENKSRNVCVGSRMGLRGIFKTRVYQENGREDMKAIRKAWYFSCKNKKENINTCKGKYLAGNTFKCKRWMFWGVDYESLISFLYFLVFVNKPELLYNEKGEKQKG